jgi:hypothetical protein
MAQKTSSKLAGRKRGGKTGANGHAILLGRRLRKNQTFFVLPRPMALTAFTLDGMQSGGLARRRRDYFRPVLTRKKPSSFTAAAMGSTADPKNANNLRAIPASRHHRRQSRPLMPPQPAFDFSSFPVRDRSHSD